MSSYIARLTGQAINLVGLVAPGAAGRLAFSLFSATDDPMPASDKARRLYERAQREMRQATKRMLVVPGGQVATHQFPPLATPDGRRHLLLHGWSSRIDYMQALVTGLRQDGAEVVGLDLPGHGASSGRRLTVPMAIDAIEAAWQRFGDFDAVIGHSFGGFTAAMSAAAPPEWVMRRTPRKLVLIAAPVAAQHIFDSYASEMGFSLRVHRAMEAAVETATGRPVGFHAADSMLKSMDGLPVLVLHAEDDKEVSAEAARLYAGAGPQVKLAWMNGLGHRRIVGSPATIEAIRNFLG